MPPEVRQPRLERLEVLQLEVGPRHPAVILQRAHRRDDHRRIRPRVHGPHGDIEELLRTQVGAESRLCHGPLAEPASGGRGEHTVAAVGDVRERPAMDERRRMLDRLHEIRSQCIAQQRSHRPGRAEVVDGHSLLRTGARDDDPAQALLEVLERGRQAEDRHDLARDDDVEGVLARDPTVVAAEPDRDLPQGTVVEIDDAPDRDAPRVDVELVAEVHVVVQHRAREVVRERDRGEVPGEVEIDVLHRQHLSPAAAGCSALHPEHRAEARLTQREHRRRLALDRRPVLLARKVSERIGKPDARRRLALTSRRRAHRGDEDEPAGSGDRLGPGREHAQRQLRRVVTMGHDVLIAQPDRRGDLTDRPELGAGRDLDISRHEPSMPGPPHRTQMSDALVSQSASRPARPQRSGDGHSLGRLPSTRLDRGHRRRHGTSQLTRGASDGARFRPSRIGPGRRGRTRWPPAPRARAQAAALPIRCRRASSRRRGSAPVAPPGRSRRRRSSRPA